MKGNRHKEATESNSKTQQCQKTTKKTYITKKKKNDLNIMQNPKTYLNWDFPCVTGLDLREQRGSMMHIPKKAAIARETLCGSGYANY